MKKIFLFCCLLLTFGVTKELSIKSEDGFILKAWLKYPKVKRIKYPLAIIVHQFDSNHTKWLMFAKKLRNRGFATLNLDLRGHGESIYQNGKLNTVIHFKSIDNLKDIIAKSSNKVKFKNISQDISLWINTVGSNYKNINIDNLAFFGASLGAAGLIGVMFEYNPKIAIFFSPGNAKEVGGEDSISEVAIPIMFIGSSGDFALNKMIKYTKEANMPTTLILPGSGHGETLLKNSNNYVKVFLNKYLK